MWLAIYTSFNIQNDYSYSLYSQLLFIVHVLSIIVLLLSTVYNCTLPILYLHFVALLIVHHLWSPILDSPFYFLLLAQVIVVTVVVPIHTYTLMLFDCLHYCLWVLPSYYCVQYSVYTSYIILVCIQFLATQH